MTTYVCSGCLCEPCCCGLPDTPGWRKFKEQRAAPVASVPFPEDPIVEAVLSRIHDRAKRGMVEYGVSMDGQHRPVVEWIAEAQEELLDAVLYLEKLKRSIGG